MRIPLTRYGATEMLLYGGGALVIAGALAWVFHPLFGVPFALIALAVFFFFRDPVRRPPADPDAVVAPADGRVIDIATVERVDFLGGPVRRVAIELGRLDVHLNRAPIAGEVVWTNYRPGRRMEGVSPDGLKVNESNWVGIRGDDGRIALVRQVSGALARRIVCPLVPRTRVERGQQIGMIKLGSRTEFFIPEDAGFVCAVKVGDKVKAGSTVIGRLHRP